MANTLKLTITIILLSLCGCNTQNNSTKELKNKEKPIVDYIDPFINTGGDHGQTDVAATVPFGMVKPSPDSDPINHSGYNNDSDKIWGFSNTRFSGVGCKGTGGNLRLLPFTDNINMEVPSSLQVDKSTEKAAPGYYSVMMKNGVHAELTATRQVAFHRYHFPDDAKTGILFDLASSFEKTLDLDYTVTEDNSILGYVESVNVCEKGKYKFYFAIKMDKPVTLTKAGDKVVAHFSDNIGTVNTYVAVSTISPESALENLREDQKSSFEEVRGRAKESWGNIAGSVRVKSENDTLKTLFYTQLYHVLQTPYQIQDPDGQYRGSDNQLYRLNENETQYFGWSIWDTFRTKDPLFSLLYPKRYSEMLTSMCKLYQQGKQPWATETEPYPTIRTEHTVALLLDGLKKGLLNFDLNAIYPALKNEIDTQLEWHSPGHVLESSYDTWAFAQIAKELGKDGDYKKYMEKAMDYKETWKNVFLNLEDDADIMHARGLYEGTLWQYRWFVPFDIEGIQEMVGGKKEFEKQLDSFFDQDLFNIGNQPDIQVPFLYNYTDSPWKSQQLVQRLLTEEVSNWYGTHEKWEKPEVRKIFQTTPHGYITEMDDDAGTMSGWYLLASMGLYQTCPGESYYWVTIPLFPEVVIDLPGQKSFTIKMNGPISSKARITGVALNGKEMKGLKIDHAAIVSGGSLEITTKE